VKTASATSLSRPAIADLLLIVLYEPHVVVIVSVLGLPFTVYLLLDSGPQQLPGAQREDGQNLEGRVIYLIINNR
jgi:hypothetical protein